MGTAVLHEDGKEGSVAGELWPLCSGPADCIHGILTLKSHAVTNIQPQRSLSDGGTSTSSRTCRGC